MAADSLPSEFGMYFEHLGPLGVGSFGRVVKAVDKSTGDMCAVKVISKDCVNPSMASQLLHEADILSNLSHPNIVKFRSVRETLSSVFIAMDLVDGGTLADLLQRRRLTDVESARVMKAVLRAVEYLHSKDIVHRDLKPENILVPKGEDLTNVKVADFGLCAQYSDSIYDALHEQCGTLLYFAPEQAEKKYYSKAVDVWSCGIILHILCSRGEHPLKVEGDTSDTYIARLKCPEWHISPLLTPMALSLFTRLTKVDPFKRYTPGQALAHPWILRRQSEIPLTSIEKFQRFNDEALLKKLCYGLVFLAKVVKWTEPQENYTVGHIASLPDEEAQEPCKKRGRSNHAPRRSIISIQRSETKNTSAFLPPLSQSKSPQKPRGCRLSFLIKPRPVQVSRLPKSRQTVI